MMNLLRRLGAGASCALLSACGFVEPAETIAIDGSSTVYPISEAVAEEFGLTTDLQVSVTIATSGTGGGFKTFCAGERDIANASRHIKAGERELCAANGVEYIELDVAIDGLSVVVNPANAFVSCMSVAELKRIWEPGSTVRLWSEVRPEWPAEPIRLYGAGTNSGTFDYFTEAIVGRVGAIRSDFSASEDDNVLVQGVEGDRNALGFFGYAYFAENAARLKAIGIDGGAGCVEPTPQTIRSGTYTPLARPLLIYVSRAAFARPVVRTFVQYYLANAEELVPQTGYVPLTTAQYAELSARVAAEAAALGAQPPADPSP